MYEKEAQKKTGGTLNKYGKKEDSNNCLKRQHDAIYKLLLRRELSAAVSRGDKQHC